MTVDTQVAKKKGQTRTQGRGQRGRPKVDDIPEPPQKTNIVMTLPAHCRGCGGTEFEMVQYRSRDLAAGGFYVDNGLGMCCNCKARFHLRIQKSSRN